MPSAHSNSSLGTIVFHFGHWLWSPIIHPNQWNPLTSHTPLAPVDPISIFFTIQLCRCIPCSLRMHVIMVVHNLHFIGCQLLHLCCSQNAILLASHQSPVVLFWCISFSTAINFGACLCRLHNTDTHTFVVPVTCLFDMLWHNTM